jgi:hypothetical protein
VRLSKYRLTDEKFGFKATLYYEYIQKTVRDRIEEMLARGE